MISEAGAAEGCQEPEGKRRWREKGGAREGGIGLAVLWRRGSTQEKLNVVGNVGEQFQTGSHVFPAGLELTGCCDPETSRPTVTGGHEINSEFFIICF